MIILYDLQDCDLIRMSICEDLFIPLRSQPSQ
jgi:hypothetical protein